MRTDDIEYQADGRRLVGHLAVDDSSPDRRPAVLVCHEGGGLAAHTKVVAERLAELGYAAFVLDYMGDGQPLPTDEATERLGALMKDPLRTRELGQAGLDVLLAQQWTDPDRIAAIGYCFGGTMSLELARGGVPLAAVVGFHSGLATSRPQDARNISGSVLVCIGTEDPYVPPEQRAAFEEEMRAAGVDWRMNLYGGQVHGFTNPSADGSREGLRYHRETDERSWRAMLDLFAEKFGPTGR